MADTRFVVGIDLGTTHCAVSTAALQRPGLHLLDVPQFVAPGEIAARTLLPSFMYLPAPGELAAADLNLPWGTATYVVGEGARKLGAKVPGRLVVSAKSWVCHGGIDRHAPILPWNAPEQETHVSPFEAQVAYLSHLCAAWQAQFEGACLADQDVVVTVPASFDEGARELTSAAAKKAGLGEVRLLEEPQAAFYDFLGAHAEDLDAQLGAAKLILVVDVGGGTTDLTLLRVLAKEERAEQGARVERVAVGGHLMLGGDNMDAALAMHALEVQGAPRPKDATVWSALVQSARVVKEQLLASQAPESAVISYQQRGSRLLGGTRSITLRRDDVVRVLLDGFFALTPATETAVAVSRAGLTTLGLPYTRDAAVPRHICAFLRRHVDAARAAGARVHDGLPQPDLLLLNGGVFRASAIQERLGRVLEHWYGESVPVLEHTSLDTAVAHGAARSALARRGVGEAIGGGTARAYYIGVEGPQGVQQALCVAPKGMQDNTRREVPDRVFELVLNQRVQFALFAYTGDRNDESGALVVIDRDSGGDALEALPQLETVLRHKASERSREGDKDFSGVRVTAGITHTGALELHLVTLELPPRRWRLQFSLRGSDDEAAAAADPETVADIVDPRVPQAIALIADVFGGADAKVAKALRRDVERVLGPRGGWGVATCRALFDACIAQKDRRGASEAHEIAWLRMAGWCLRPGFGAADDTRRQAALWALREQGLVHHSKAAWAQWWVMWRRIAAGLDAQAQVAMFESLRPWLWREGKPPVGPHAHGPAEMMQLLAALEHLDPADKQAAGELFFTRIKKIGSYWPLARVGARVPFVGDSAQVLPAEQASQWLHRLLELDWEHAEGAAFASASLARCSGDPVRDVPESLRAQVAERLRKIEAPSTWVDMVVRAANLSEGDLKRLLGDALPAGLRLTLGG